MYAARYENLCWLGSPGAALLPCLPNLSQRQHLGLADSELVSVGTGWAAVGASARELHTRYQAYLHARTAYPEYPVFITPSGVRVLLPAEPRVITIDVAIDNDSP